MSKEKKKSNKQLTSPNHNPNLWPDLPQQLLYQLARKPSLMLEIYSKGATKSWRTEPNKCSKSSNATLPWLEVSTDNENSQNQPHTFNISFRSGSYSYRSPQYSPVIEGYHFLGCSYGLLISKGDSDYKLWDPIDNGWWHLPLWDNRIPFLCTALSSMPMIDNKKNKSTLIVLTGISNPAFAYCRIWEGGDWIKKDSNIVDPNDHKGHLLKFSNGIWFKEKFYALSLQGTLAVIEEIDCDLRITAVGKKRAAPSVSCMHFKECLVESEGKLLLIFLISKNSIKTVDFVEVYELNTDKLAWIKKDNIENKTLFVGANCCMFTFGNKVGFKGNCIYFSNSYGDGWWVYEMETGSVSRCSISNPDKSQNLVE
ncbi:uncharacterized protein LOC119369801 [Jatropha curcas]|uniref:uncharacterized protein LOC119369801 n=1 Tax=Jatropha curcas TaxID=180498 RepID=UPI001894EB24|nr:uncharacterized protein LOC119369801 [Jatropha curcas]